MKKTLSFVLSLIMILTTLTALPLSVFATERTYIPAIEATSDIESIVGYGNNIVNPTFTVTTGAPAKFNAAGTMNWYKKNGDDWENCGWNSTFSEGTYKLICDFGLYRGDNSSFNMDESTTLTVDGASWTMGSYVNANSYEYKTFISPEFEVHDFREWKSDGTNHWHECPNCGKIQDTAAHVPDHTGSATTEYAIACSVCDYEIEPQIGHTHAFTQEVVADKYKKENATCHSKAVYYKSCECGRKGTETFETGDMLPHKESSQWETDDDYHWHVCLNEGCGAVIESSKAAHVYDGDTDYRCNVCKFKREDNRTHISKIEATSDIESIVGYGKTITTPTITVTAGSPAKVGSTSTIGWSKKDGNGWTYCSNGSTVTCGTYRLTLDFGLYHYDNDCYKLSEDTTITVDGNDWSVIRYYYGDYYEYITVCSQEFTVHTPVTDPAVAATCTTDGKTEGSHCSTCGEVIVAQQTVKAKGHQIVTDAPVAATYTETGLTSGTHCSVCGEIFTAQKVVPKLKKANPLTAKAKKATVKYSKLSRKKQTIKRSKAITVKNAKGKVTYKIAKKNKNFTVAKNGKITVKKGLKKGTYKVKIKVTAAGNSEYAKATKTVTVKIKVK